MNFPPVDLSSYHDSIKFMIKIHIFYIDFLVLSKAISFALMKFYCSHLDFFFFPKVIIFANTEVNPEKWTITKNQPREKVNAPCESRGWLVALSICLATPPPPPTPSPIYPALLLFLSPLPTAFRSPAFT